MWIGHHPLLCRACHHEWEGEILQDVEISTWLAHTKALRCPKCGANWKRLSFKLDGTQKATKHASEGE